jgi:hypothetical protein
MTATTLSATLISALSACTFLGNHHLSRLFNRESSRPPSPLALPRFCMSSCVAAAYVLSRQVLEDDLNKLWDSIAKPPAYQGSSIADFFEVRG